MVGRDGAAAAHRIAQHSINHPDVMRRCRDLLDRASTAGLVPRWHFAYIDDRIRVFEGRPQRYGTQWRGAPTGLEPYPLDDPDGVDGRRADLGLPSMSAIRAAGGEPEERFDPETARRQDELEVAWRRKVGWIR
jgi:hypothetical protein